MGALSVSQNTPGFRRVAHSGSGGTKGEQNLQIAAKKLKSTDRRG